MIAQLMTDKCWLGWLDIDAPERARADLVEIS
jgi:hypothetical protein